MPNKRSLDRTYIMQMVTFLENIGLIDLADDDPSTDKIFDILVNEEWTWPVR